MRADLLLARARILRALRSWMEMHGYREVATPILVPSPALEEHLEAVRVEGGRVEGGRVEGGWVEGGWLHTSPEFAMKRVLAAGLCRIYQVVPCFREEEKGPHHTREFTMVEWYRVGAGTAELMDDTEALLVACAGSVGVTLPPFDRKPVAQLVAPALEPEAWFRQWVDVVEPTLTGPTIVHGYPAWQAALARVKGGVADRFEVYLGGIELANAFAEELDGQEIEQRWTESNQARVRAGRSPHPVDRAFLQAVDRMPKTAGIALGLDRLVMALTGARSIDDVQVGR